MTNGNRWTWDEEKNRRFPRGTENYKRQKLAEGVEWDSYKVALFMGISEKESW